MTMPLAGLLVTIAVIILGIVDLCFVLFSGTPSSISNFMIRMGFKAPAVVFAFGYVCGHIWGGMRLKASEATKDELDELCKEKKE